METAVNALSPICPTKTLSTILYNACMSMDITVGIAIPRSSLFSGITPILFSLFKAGTPFVGFCIL
jgi:hypothetical protein